MDQLSEILSVNNQQEKNIWEDNPSHVSMVGGYFISVALVLALGLLNHFFNLPLYFLVMPFFLLIWCYLVIKCSKYTLTSQRLKYTYGVLNQKEDQMELYRIKDYRLEKPLYLRVFGLSNIYVDTSDRTCPVFGIFAVENGEKVIEEIRRNVERRREERFIRELDVN
mgnify:CR=1 FL=1